MLSAALAPAAAYAQEAPPASDACSFSEILPASEFDTTERGAFTSDGRFFFIGTRVPLTSYLVELTKEGDRHVATNYVTGTLAGTSDGTLDGSPAGDACLFTGMAVHGHVLYAGCMTLDGRASLHQIDTRARTVRAGAFTSCNFEPAREPCQPVPVFPNGMAVDGAGRIYFSDMTTHFALHPERVYSVGQIEIDPAPGTPGELRFRHRTWLGKDLLADGLAPNGIQIEGDLLYYVGGANLTAIPIRADGSAGERRVAYQGPLLSYIDDFALDAGEIAIARTLPSALVRLGRPLAEGAAKSEVTCTLPPLAPPSSITYQPDLGARALFPAGTLIVTSFFGGGLYTLPPR